MQPTSVSDKRSDQETKGSNLSLKVGEKGPEFGAQLADESRRAVETTTNYSVQHQEKIIFPAVSGPIRKALQHCNSHLYVLIDEWSSIPMDIQPYLAEFLKRSILPLPEVTVKIASLEYRSDFSITPVNGSIIGFEMGADISAFLDIDDYYVFDRNPDGITDSFGDMLVRHLINELPPQFLVKNGVIDGRTFASKLFTERKVFQEL